MERRIKERRLREKVQERKVVHRYDIKRKTVATLQRESQNKSIKKQVDFESVIEMAARFKRTGDTDKLTETDRDKLMRGSKG